MQPHEMAPALLQPVAVIIRDRNRVPALQTALHVAQPLAPLRAEAREIALPISTQLEVGTDPEWLALDRMAAGGQAVAQSSHAWRVRRQIAQDDDLPVQFFEQGHKGTDGGFRRREQIQ